MPADATSGVGALAPWKVDRNRPPVALIIFQGLAASRRKDDELACRWDTFHASQPVYTCNLMQHGSSTSVGGPTSSGVRVLGVGKLDEGGGGGT